MMKPECRIQKSGVGVTSGRWASHARGRRFSHRKRRPSDRPLHQKTSCGPIYAFTPVCVGSSSGVMSQHGKQFSSPRESVKSKFLSFAGYSETVSYTHLT